jgi:hypothetical protein
MTELKVGDPFPDGVEFSWAPYQADDEVIACGMPQKFDASKGKFVTFVLYEVNL